MKGRPTDEDLEIAEYWSRAATRRGRLLLNARIWLKRRVWLVVIGGTRLMKRLFDIYVGGFALVALSPVFAVTALLIKLEDGGPLFFRQTRVGRRGETFGMWKFRSMIVDAEKVKEELLEKNEMKGGVTFKMKDDPRITRVGKWIRKFSIDELPQFWNVLVGEMSVVGPRPPVPREVAEYSVEDRQRLLAKPGLTCFWQVGGRSEIDFEGQVRLDVQYIRSESFWLDIKLLLKTIPAVLLGKGAY